VGKKAHGPSQWGDGPGFKTNRGQRLNEAFLPHDAAFLQAARRDLRFRRDVERLHRLGPRVLFEALSELGAIRLCRFEIEELVARYAALDAATLRAAGADRMPPLPLRLVRP